MKQNAIYLGAAEPVLKQFQEFVLKWQKSVNLISPGTVNDIWNRHILDCAQLFEHIPATAEKMADMGTGGGFPGIVLAIMNKELTGPLDEIYFIESDIKKSIFLKEAVRTFGLKAVVINERIENVRLNGIDIVTARALKELGALIKMGQGFITAKTTCLFLKGERADEEILRNPYPCHLEKIKSKTADNGVILKIGELHI